MYRILISHFFIVLLLFTSRLQASNGQDEIAVVSLGQNLSFIEKVYGFVEQYMTIMRRHQAMQADDHIFDLTGEELIGIEQPDAERGNNFYLVVDNKRQLLFSKDFMGFAAYEHDIPVYAIISTSTKEVYAVFIGLGKSNNFLKLTVTRGLGSATRVVDPNRLLFGNDGFHHVSQDELFVHAAISALDGELMAPILRLSYCPPSIWVK